jgi:hypothetical protein
VEEHDVPKSVQVALKSKSTPSAHVHSPESGDSSVKTTVIHPAAASSKDLPPVISKTITATRINRSNRRKRNSKFNMDKSDNTSIEMVGDTCSRASSNSKRDSSRKHPNSIAASTRNTPSPRAYSGTHHNNSTSFNANENNTNGSISANNCRKARQSGHDSNDRTPLENLEETEIEMLEKEDGTFSSLCHPGISQVHDIGERKTEKCKTGISLYLLSAHT